MTPAPKGAQACHPWPKVGVLQHTPTRSHLGTSPHFLGPGVLLPELPPVLADELVQERQHQDIARREAALGEARREQVAVVHLPTVPARPGHVAGANSKQPESGPIRRPVLTPAPVSLP